MGKTMPIDKKEFEDGKLNSKVEQEILNFVHERKTRAFTSQEIMGGIHLHTEFSTPEITKMSTFAISDFTALLYDLVKRKEIRMRIIRGRMHFTAHVQKGTCPKCNVGIYTPEKSWKMTGRPNRKGIRTQLQIGLFKCPEHGFFRVVLGKSRIQTETQTTAPKKQIKKRKARSKAKSKTSQRRTPKKKHVKPTKKKAKKTKKWSLI
jgi:hypothetical protein